eukprot:3995392-Prymnesium_polylepis.1
MQEVSEEPAAAPTASAAAPNALSGGGGVFLRVLAGREEWARVYGQMHAKQKGERVPAPTEWHEPEADLYPGLTAKPFHAAGDAWYAARTAEAVAHLERFYPVIKEELLALRLGTLKQYRQPNSAIRQEREVSADGTSALLHEFGDWKVLHLQLEGKDTREQCKLAPRTAKVVRSTPRSAGHALCEDAALHTSPHGHLARP